VDKLADKKKFVKNTVGAAPSINDISNSAKITPDVFIRHIAAGTEYYSGHARNITRDLIAASEGQKSGPAIKDEAKLRRIAMELGIQTANRPENEVAGELGKLLLNEFTKQQGELFFLKRAPRKRQEIWHNAAVAPSGIDGEIAATRFDENNPDSGSPLMQSARCALANGWGCQMIAAELGDMLSGTPFPILTKAGRAEMVTGFSPESIIYSLGGSFRGSLHPLIDNIVNGRIRGIAGIFNCRENKSDDAQMILAQELIKNDILVLFTGDNAESLAQAGLMVYEGAQFAGEGLHSVCEAVGLPPVLNMGNSIDSCRILIAAAAIVQEGKLGDISDLPACVAATENLNDKTTAIGQCFVSSGFYTVSSDTRLSDSKELSADMEKMTGGKWGFTADPRQMAQKMITHIDNKRKALGIDKARERVLYDMAMRRELT
jgi:hydroxylamine reductase (hybrid-cluster protein)